MGGAPAQGWGWQSSEAGLNTGTRTAPGRSQEPNLGMCLWPVPALLGHEAVDTLSPPHPLRGAPGVTGGAALRTVRAEQ